MLTIKRKRGKNMAQLWGGRFTKETDRLVYNFNASITFDQKFFHQDVRGSIAHVTMLAEVGILTEEEKQQIIDGLNGIVADVDAGRLEITTKTARLKLPWNMRIFIALLRRI